MESRGQNARAQTYMLIHGFVDVVKLAERLTRRVRDLAPGTNLYSVLPTRLTTTL